MGRKKARDNAFKCVYQLEFLDKDYDIEKILESCYEENENVQEEKDYIESTLKGVIENMIEIDNIILSNLKNWTFPRIAKIDLAILRVAIYELKFSKESTPVKVVANEAVELAKMYGNSDSKSFVNGLIAKVIEDVSSELKEN